jgi:acetyl esterase
MPVDPELQPIVDLVHAVDLPAPHELGAEAMRANFDLFSESLGTGPADVSTADLQLATRAGRVPVRIYHPAGLDGDAGALVFLHGGGFVIGDLASHDGLCRLLAHDAGIVVVAVDYRRAPEHPFPAAADDAEDALAAVVERAADLGIDPGRVAVGGDSAGGNLAAVTARRWRDRTAGTDLPALRLQLLVYPVCDLDHDPERFASLRENADGYVLTAETMQFFADSYVPDRAQRSSPDASPIEADDLSGLAPALVITAEYDPLRDEGEAYGARLADAGVPTTVTRYDGAIHMFFHMAELTGIGRRAVDQAVAALRSALA